MRRWIKCIALLLCMSILGSTIAYGRDLKVEQALQKGIKTYEGKKIGDWSALALFATGESLESREFFKTTYDEMGTTDCARRILRLLAEGKDVKSYVEALQKVQQPNGKFADRMNGKGMEQINAHVWSILALYSVDAEYDVPRARQWLISAQNKDGGFHHSTVLTTSDTDMTAMALCAMAALGIKQEEQAVQKTLTYVRNMQAKTGGFVSSYSAQETAETTSWVILGLVSMGIDPTSKQWTKWRSNPITALLRLQHADGRFKHLPKDRGGNNIATHQAVLALASYERGSVFEQLRDRDKE